jgi:phenylacetate-CoA ligase
MNDRRGGDPPQNKFWHDYIDTMPRAELERLQEARLLHMIERCYPGSPLLQELWTKSGVRRADIRSVSDFKARVPFMDKDSVREYRDRHGDPFGGLVRATDPMLRMVTSTSGTTGDATPLTWSHRSVAETAYQRNYYALGARSGDYLLHSTFTFRVGQGQTGPAEGGLIPIVLDHTAAEVPRIIEASLRFRPTVFVIMSSPLMIALEEYFEKSDIDPREVFKSYKVVIFGGEALGPRQRALARSWGIELYEMMALGDVSIAMECEMHDGCHPNEDLALVECLDPNGSRAVADGEVGELVVTMLGDPLLPLVRFRTDDLMIVNREPCGCGRTQMRYRMMGRKSDQIIVSGRSVLPMHVRMAIEEEFETRAGLFQIIKFQAQMDELRLRVGHNPAALRTTAAELGQRLQSKLEAVLKLTVSIDLVPDAELLKLGPPHKIPRVTKQ